MSETSNKLRIQIQDDNGQGKALSILWPGEEPSQDDEGLKTLGIIYVKLDKTRERVLPLLRELDKQLPDEEITDILNMVAQSILDLLNDR